MKNLAVPDPFALEPLEWFSRLLDENFHRRDFGLEEGTLALDVSQTDKELIVRASLPGFRKEDIDVQVQNGVLSIKAEYAEEDETKNEWFYRCERRRGSMSRRIALPGVVSEDETHAEFADGVLTLRIPLSEKAKPHRIDIN